MPQRTPKELRKFGVTVGGAFVVLGSLSWWRGHEIPPIVLWCIGGALLLPGLVFPAALAPVERAWLRLAAVLAAVNTRAILTVLYYAMMTPIGAVLRLFRDPLDRKLDASRSNWKPRAGEPMTRERYEQQF
jgi:hypothetical protein